MGGPARSFDRGRALDELVSRRFDLLVVGGGIVGAGIAAHAARAGLAVALVEAGDFAGATSSASSKLIHGGLRYLRLGDVGLVRESHTERHVLETTVAPHLVRPLPFLLPLYRGGPYRPWLVKTGVVAYSALAREWPTGFASPGEARRRVPALRLADLHSCAAYTDAWTNDARLCLANVRAAFEAGATVVNGTEVTALRLAKGTVAGAEVACEGDTAAITARTVVNATGPWLDTIRALETPRAGTSVRLSKGAHVLVTLDRPWASALTIPHDAVRVTFAVPWYGMLLLGTTDTLHESGPGEVSADEGDVELVLEEAAAAVEPDLLRREHVRAAYAGLRVLPLGEDASVNARRETIFLDGPAGMLSVAGGKLTTYRRIALDALDRLRGRLGGQHRIERRPWPLPGAAGVPASLGVEVEPDVRDHLLHLYGSLATEVLEPARRDPALLERLHPDGPDIAAQVLYASTHEWARGVEDVVRRRTTLAVRGLADADTSVRIERLLASRTRAS